MVWVSDSSEYGCMRIGSVPSQVGSSKKWRELGGKYQRGDDALGDLKARRMVISMLPFILPCFGSLRPCQFKVKKEILLFDLVPVESFLHVVVPVRPHAAIDGPCHSHPGARGAWFPVSGPLSHSPVLEADSPF